MDEFGLLKGKTILVVDDEPDVLEILEELLGMCEMDQAPDFETARELLERKRYDVAILDIMGVNGYDLLDLAAKKSIPTLMLTANALTAEDFLKSIRKGAHAYIPKEKLSEIATFLTDVLEADQKGSTRLGKWFSRLEDFFDKKFGYYWKEKIKEDPDFWKDAL